MRICKPPFRSKLVKVGRLQLARAIATEVAITQVIGKDEDNVGLWSFAEEEEGRKSRERRSCFILIRQIGLPTDQAL